MAEPKPWFVDEESLPFAALPGATAHWGVHANAGYRIEVPDNWNGDLVLYAHGFRGNEPRLFVSNPPLRAFYISQGYAWAASSYSANGYMPGTGARDTHRLLQRFNGLIDRPNRVYLTGDSMGGHVTGIAIEQWPRSFDGALPRCGVMGDFKLFDYFQDAYLAAETLVGNDPEIPSPADYGSSGAFAAAAAMGPAFPVLLNETGERFKRIIENLTGGPRPTFEQGWLGGSGGAFVLFGVAGTTDGAQNLDTEYRWTSFSEPTAEEVAFNDSITRIAPPPQFRPRGPSPQPGTRGQADIAPISGQISMPVLTLHTIGELFVPFSMQQIYAERVAEQGNAPLLVQRAIRATGHCTFTPAELVEAFSDLVNWVENGVVPGGDNVLDPVNVASPDFGCAYTRGTRSGIPACE